MPGRPPLRMLVAVALVTACTLALQVVLTRLFSAVLAYHFSFVAISLALLGTGAGALFVYLVPRWFERISLERLLARWTAAFGALLVVIPFGLVWQRWAGTDEAHFPSEDVVELGQLIDRVPT